MIRREFVEPGKALVEEVAGRIAARAEKLPSGAASLGHILVVAPTHEASRRLREALARRLGAVVAPLVTTSAGLLGGGAKKSRDEAAAEETMRLATLAKLLRASEAGDFPILLGRLGSGERKFAEYLDAAAMLIRVWRILSEGALLMRDVYARAADILKGDGMDFEIARWKELSRLEESYLAHLHAMGLTLPAEETKAAIAGAGEREDWKEIREIVLPGLVAPPEALIKVLSASGRDITVMIHASEVESDAFDDWGRLGSEKHLQDLGLEDKDILAYATPGAEAAAAAEFMGAVASEEALPALVMAEPGLYPELESAFALKALALHNPAKSLVAASSLGRLAAQLLALAEGAKFAVFSAFLRQGDVQRFLERELGLGAEQMAAALDELDALKAAHLPETIAEARRYATGDLAKIFDTLGAFYGAGAAGAAGAGAAGGGLEQLREALIKIFAARELDEKKASDREFAAAAEALGGLFDAFGRLELPPEEARALFAKALETASYSLEPGDEGVMLTAGWLEVPYLDEDELLITGMEEGAVPESLVGHAFVPDSLRKALGLTTNEVRTRRDAFILREAVASRAKGAVKMSFHKLAADGSALKPSRLLLRTVEDKVLAERAGRLYAVPEEAENELGRSLPEAWRLALPLFGSPEDAEAEERERTHLSPSLIDTYLKCPFTYFLKTRLGGSVKDGGEELDAAEFGQLCHEALDGWAKSGGGDETDEKAIAAALALRLDALVAERFGLKPPALIMLQADSARMRLEWFAKKQAAWRREGWKIVETECDMRVVYEGVEICGRVDRIDRNEKTGEWCVVDYKTWDTMDRASQFDETRKAVEFAKSRGLSVATIQGPRGAKEVAWRSLQLPLYCAMLEAQGRARPISACYCVLGETEDETGFSAAARADDWAAESDKLVREVIRSIAAGRFWPPSPNDDWSYDYSGLMFSTPEESVDEKWIESQTGGAAVGAGGGAQGVGKPRAARIAVTGGIACGKSRFAAELRKLGVETLDADDVVHRILPEKERKRLVAEGVFSNEEKRRELQARIWPLVREEFDRWEAEAGEGIRVAIIPLLFEAHWSDKYDIICCVICEEGTQIERMMQTRGYSRDEACGRMAAQMPVSEKAAQSQYVIHNDGSGEELEKEAAKFVEWLKEERKKRI